jgi:fructokinase
MAGKKFDVTALGELLIDFTQSGDSPQGNPLYEANPGGAPCNVLAMLEKLGRKTAFIGKVGKDGFGRQLKAALEETGISCAGLVMDQDVHTTLALVHKLPDGDRDFSFYRRPGADMNLTAQEVPVHLIQQARIFHFGTLSMTDEPVRSATRKAIEAAEAAGCLRSFDPNLRPPLWSSLDDAHKAVDFGLRHCDILKISDNEIQWFTGREDFGEGIRFLQETYHIPLIGLSLGRDGSRAYANNLTVEMPAFLQDATIDTTGAGDTFCACMLEGVLTFGLDGFTEDTLRQTLQFANAAASLVTTRRGALRMMPEKEEIERFLAERKQA